MDSNTKKFCVIMVIAAVVFVFALMAQSCAEESKKRTHLEYFRSASGVSISSNGNQVMFTGCGHEDFSECAAYRYDRKEDKLYRYIHEDTSMQIMAEKYWPASQRFLCALVPRAKDRKQLIEQMQIAIVNIDGTGLRRLTEGAGVKGAHMLSPDGKIFVYAKGRERTEGKTIASHFDFYARNLTTGKETRITKLSFYEVGTPYFTPDGKHIIFDHYGILGLAGDFDKEYEAKYGQNMILQYPIDGSGINRLPEPWFNHENGSEDPIMTRDGSLIFRTARHDIRYFIRSPSGNISEITDEQLGTVSDRYPYQIAVEPTGRWMAIIYEYYKGRGRTVEILDIKTMKRTPVSIPATVTNITVHEEN